MFCRLLRLFVRNRSGEGEVDLVIKEYFLLISFKRNESCKKLISYPFRFTSLFHTSIDNRGKFQNKTECSWLEKCHQNKTFILQDINLEKLLNECIEAKSKRWICNLWNLFPEY